jgi:hypothetical protein
MGMNNTKTNSDIIGTLRKHMNNCGTGNELWRIDCRNAVQEIIDLFCGAGWMHRESMKAAWKNACVAGDVAT